MYVVFQYHYNYEQKYLSMNRGFTNIASRKVISTNTGTYCECFGLFLKMSLNLRQADVYYLR